MSTEDGFNTSKAETKGYTNPEGDGLSSGYSFTTLNSAPESTYEVSVKKGGKASDTTQVFSGPRTGVERGVGTPEDSKGFITSTGNEIAIHGTPGSESIEIIHHSGAQIMIDVDGSIFLMPTSRKGFGLHSNRGDGVVSAQGRLILKGHSDITIETEGSMTFNVGQNMFMNVGKDFVLDVGGSFSESVDGAKTVEVVKDYSQTIGGVSRETIAGSKRVQSVGDIRFDTGHSVEARADHDVKLYASKSMLVNSIEDSFFEVTSGKLSLLSNDDTTLASKGALYVSGLHDVSVEAAQTLAIRGANVVTSASDTVYVDATNLADVRSSVTKLSSTGEMNFVSGSMNQSTTGAFNFNATGAIDIRGSTIDLNKTASSAQSVRPVEVTSQRAVPDIETPPAAEWPDTNTIIDTMTTERISPTFPLNAKKMSQNEMSLYENEGDTPDANAKATASGNASGGTPYSKGDSAGTVGSSGNVGYDGSSNNTKAEGSPVPAPVSIDNGSEKLSRHLTVGGFPGLGSLPLNQMGYSRKEILENVRHLSYNIIDPVLDRFGSSVQLLHGIRLGQGGSRHYIGKAIDIRSSGRDHVETAMIAKWIVENLPYDRCFLEANAQGTIHCHVEAAPEGSSGARTVWTCADPKCSSKVDGIQLSFAQQGLRNMGFA